MIIMKIIMTLRVTITMMIKSNTKIIIDKGVVRRGYIALRTKTY